MTKSKLRLVNASWVAILFAALIAAGATANFVPEAAAAPSTVNVTIKNFSFNPATISVVIGVNNTVTWTNADGVPHTVTGYYGSFDSGILNPGDPFTHTFLTAGIFSYLCNIHPYMKGTVIAKAPGANSTTTSSSSTSTTTSASSTTTSSSSTTRPASSSSSTSTSSTPAPKQSTSTVASSSTASSYGTPTAIPAFPYGAVTLTLVVLLVVGSYLLVRRTAASHHSPQ